MGRESDRTPPVESPDEVVSQRAPAGGTTWPTWDDIARLHRIPDADGVVPAPPPEPDEPAATTPDDEAEPAPQEVADDETAVIEPVEDVAGDDGPDGADGEVDSEVGAVAVDEVAVDEVAVDEVAVDEVAVDDTGDDETADDETADDETAVIEPVDDEVAGDVTAVIEPVEDADADAVADDETVETLAEAVVDDEATGDEVADDDTAGDEVADDTAGDETAVIEPVDDAADGADDAADGTPGEAVDDGTVVDPAVDETVVLTAVADPDVPARVSAFPRTTSEPTSSPRVTAGPVPTPAVAEREPSVLDEFAPQEHKRRWPWVVSIVGGILLLLVGGYVGLSHALGDRVPSGATVAGVDIGGLREAAAVQLLTDELLSQTADPIAVAANDLEGEIDPTAAGLTFDPQATVDSLTGVNLSEPGRLWRQLTGVGEVAPATAVDQEALAAAVAGIAGTLRVEPVDATIVFVDGEAHATPATEGWALDEPAAVQTLVDQWLVGTRPLALPTATLEPDITQAEADQILADVARRVAGGPVTAQVGENVASLDAATLAANASFVPEDGTLVLRMNGEALRDVVLAQLPGVLTEATDASFSFETGAPVLVPGEPGTTLDPAQVAAAVAEAASKPTGRQAVLELVPTDPAETTAALEALGIKEVVGAFSTPLTSDKVRDVNIKQGVANITGVLVRPGEEFSLTEALGPIDAAHGFVPAGAIVNGVHTDAWGGGLSQVSTTTYNAAYLAGMEIVEHHPHSEWFSRYPEGREATIFTGTLDMRWKNNTPYGVLVQGWVEGGRVHVQLWSTAYWRVESETSGRWGVTQPTIVYNQKAGCEPQSKGNPGFSVRVTRRTFLGDELKNTEQWTTTYRPQNQVICGPPPATP